MNRPLEGRIVAITGAASGIGRSCALDAARAGARVAAIDIDADRVKETREAIVADGGEARAYTLDVCDADAIEESAAEIESAMGPVDGFVACAGLIQPNHRPETLPVDVFDRIVAVNQRGLYLSCVAFGRRMAERGGGSIVTIASITATRSIPLHAYGPTKAAVLSITRNLASEWGRSNVRVNAVSPGYVLTPGLQAAIDRGDRDPTALIEASAMGRMVEPGEIADGVTFLLSDRASAITGIDLPIDLGWLCAPGWQTYGGVPAARSAG